MKNVSIYVCVALLIVSMILTWTTDLRSDIHAGKGSGINESIDSPEDFQDLLLWLSRNEIPSADVDRGVTVLANDKSYTGSSKDDGDEDQVHQTKDFDSMTVREEAYVSVKDYSYYNINNGLTERGKSEDTKAMMNRSMTLYITKDERYYHSVGQMLVDAYAAEWGSQGREEDGEQLYLDFDMEIYINYSQGKIYLKVNKWTALGNKVVTFSDEMIGKWASISRLGDIVEDLNGADGLNEETFNMLLECIDTAIQEEDIRGNKDSYIVEKNEKDSNDGEEEEVDMKLSLNLADRERPVVSMYVDQESSKENWTLGGGDAYTNACAEVTYTFENINNTVIEMDDDVDVLELTLDNMDQYIYIED